VIYGVYRPDPNESMTWFVDKKGEAFGITLAIEDLLHLVPEIKYLPRSHTPVPAPLESLAAQEPPSGRQGPPDARPPEQLPTTPAELSLKEALSELSDTEKDVYNKMKTDPPLENERAYATRLWNGYFKKNKKKVGLKTIQNIVSKLRNMPALRGG
jgi:hypothetical protein